MWLCFIVISVVTDGGTFPVEVYLVNNSSKTPVTKVELITNEQNESWSLFSFVQICFTNQQPAAGASFSHLWAAAAPDACRPGFPPHTDRCCGRPSLLGARCCQQGSLVVSHSRCWGLTGRTLQVTARSAFASSLESREHMQMTEQRATWENTHVRNELLLTVLSEIRSFFFYNYYFLFFCDVTKMLNNETCSLKWKVS